ncbi:MAG: type I-E CRISPR-associated protein Cas7/Cse4/CasC [Anaerolineae bacterium]
MYLEVHLIQNFAPANLNRDDTNNPKDCEFGGVRRARISSQCIKRAIRTEPIFTQTTGVEVGERTKRVVERLSKQIGDRNPSSSEAEVILPAVVTPLLSKMDKDGQRTAVLLYLSASEIASISDRILENWQELADEQKRSGAVSSIVKETVKEYKGRTSAPDIALFGRMLAEKPELNIDAACQVAHALSTHRVAMEMDFYTAVDDLNPDDIAGAGMMGFTGYNSACFYRYARLDWQQLLDNLNGDTDLALRTVTGFLLASVQAVPTGKQNSFGAQNPPSFLLAVVRDGGNSWSLANAFEKPVRAVGDSGLVHPSVKALDSYWGRLENVYGTNSIKKTAALALDADIELSALQGARVSTLQSWVDTVVNAIQEANA